MSKRAQLIASHLHPPEASANSYAVVDQRFARFLETLDAAQRRKALAMRAEIELNYRAWAEQYEILKTQFGAVWKLFGQIEAEVTGWHRNSPHGGRWGYLALTREGYSFAAGIERNHRRGAPYASKWLTVMFAYGLNGRNGMGDERCLGRVSDIDDNLAGLENCEGKDLNQQLKAAQQLRAKLDDLDLLFHLHDDRLGQKSAKVKVQMLKKHDLKALCQQLYVALNRDAFTEFSQFLPAPEPAAVAAQQKRLLIGGS